MGQAQDGPLLRLVHGDVLLLLFDDDHRGLGLAVSRQIIEAHGGTVTIESRTDRAGAVATLSLPIAGSEA